jgi:glutathione S-transferase
MNQPALTLYHFPGACSQVSLCALEQAGLAYELELVNLASNAQSEPGYKAISPLGKVPTLVIDGDPLTENAAILTYIAALRPEAGLFPTDPSPRVRADIAGGLSFCGGTLHPTIRGIANPSRMTTGDGAPVREKSTELAHKSFGYAEKRLAARGWWLDEPSIVDVYLNWALSVARNAGFDVSELPLLATLRDRLMERPAFARMQEIEAESRTKLGL